MGSNVTETTTMFGKEPNAFQSSLLLLHIENLESFDTSQLEEAASYAVSRCLHTVTVVVTCHELRDRRTLDDDQQKDVWINLQQVLRVLYGSATRRALKDDKPLFDFEVLIAGWCNENASIGKDRLYDVMFALDEDQASVSTITTDRELLGLEPLPAIYIPETLRGTGVLPYQHNADIPTCEHSDAAVGGTFDHLHAGHKILLTMAAWVPTRRLVCGVTSAQMLKNKKCPEYLESEETRRIKVQDFLQRIRADLLYDVVIINDPCGPTATDGSITALIASAETKEGARQVNDIRRKNGLAELDTYVIDLVEGLEGLSGQSYEEGGKSVQKLSSTFIREWLKAKTDRKIEA